MSTNKLLLGGFAAAVVGVAFVAATAPAWAGTNAQGGPWGNATPQALHTPVAPGTGSMGQMGAMGQGHGGRWGSSETGAPMQAMQATHLAALPAADPAGLAQNEIDGLLYMREEEKLAHDVYVALSEKWGLTQFTRIAASEQMHTDAVMTLLDRYGIADPASSEAGLYADPTLQALYNDLIARGSVSAVEALNVGGLIEEVDMADLDTRLAANDQADIAAVYANLRSASENHLRAFANGVQALTGTAYTAQTLSADAVSAILSGSNGRGYGAGNGMGTGMGSGPRHP